MLKSELIKLLNNKYPFKTQEEWDNCGPNPTNFCDDSITKIFVSLDMNEETLQKALKNKCNVIITHHPILISDEMTIIDKQNLKLIKKLNKYKVLNISLHTCFDIHKNGTSYLIAKNIISKLNLTKIEQVKNNKFLVKFNLKNKISLNQFLNLLKDSNLSYFNNLRYINNQENKLIKTVCIGAGSCSSFISDVIKERIDCFLTGDVKWHNFLDAYNNDLVIVDIGHQTERVFINEISQFINKNNHELKIIHDYDLFEILSK